MTTAGTEQPTIAKKRRSPLRIILLLIAIILLLLWPTAREHLRAMSLLARMEGKNNVLSRLDHHIYDVKETSIANGGYAIQARLYVPRGSPHPPAMVVVHGLHQLGMNEPRLVAFAGALAQTGVEVLTPQLDAIADYRVEPQSIEVIGDSAETLAQQAGLKQVGVLGLSFAGGLALMAAANPKYSNEIGFIAAVGAQDDTDRVEHYLVEGQTHWPDGKLFNVPPHEYGWLILIYSHPEDFFPAGDAEKARASLRLLLHENVAGAKREAQQLSPAGQQLMDKIFEHQRDAFRQRLLAHLNKHEAEALAVSPHNHLSGLKARVLLIHGEGDDVIPPSESEWLARDIPKGHLQEALVSRAISHVSLEHAPGLRDQLSVMHWIALMLNDADHESVAKPAK
ncbi:MAG TPA: alpha/beta hydrolase [Tepidisphaeraceae bacterium]|nr:alpha/beta hydrolase [Tepidisphaeraceae bacterium]